MRSKIREIADNSDEKEIISTYSMKPSTTLWLNHNAFL